MHRYWEFENLNQWLGAVYFEKEKTIYFCNSCPSSHQQAADCDPTLQHEAISGENLRPR